MAAGRQARSEGVGDMNQLGSFADRTILIGGPADAAGCPQQLRVGIADVQAGEPAAAELLQDRIPSKPVIDLRRCRQSGATTKGLRPEAHWRKGSAALPAPVDLEVTA